MPHSVGHVGVCVRACVRACVRVCVCVCTKMLFLVCKPSCIVVIVCSLAGRSGVMYTVVISR